MSVATNLLLHRGELRAQDIRPATLTTATGIPMRCKPGNFDFFERLAEGGGGFTAMNHLHVTVLRSHIPEGITFKRGDNVTVTNDETGENYSLVIGQNNSSQAEIIVLNLESTAA